MAAHEQHASVAIIDYVTLFNTNDEGAETAHHTSDPVEQGEIENAVDFLILTGLEHICQPGGRKGMWSVRWKRA